MDQQQPEERGGEHGAIVPSPAMPESYATSSATGPAPLPGPQPGYQPSPPGYQPYVQQPQAPHNQQAPFGYPPPGAAPQYGHPYPPPYYQPQPIYVTQQVMAPAAAYVATAPPKSVGLALLLTFFFGPLGLFYASVTGGIVMLIVTIVAAAFTLGISVLVTWPVCMIWSAIAANNANMRGVSITNYTQNAPR